MGVVSAPEACAESSGGGAVFDKGGAGFEAAALLAFASLPGPFLLTLGLHHTCLCHNLVQTDQGKQALSHSVAIASWLLHRLLARIRLLHLWQYSGDKAQRLERRHSRSCLAVISATVISHVSPGQSQGLSMQFTPGLSTALNSDFVCFLATRNYIYAEFATRAVLRLSRSSQQC